METGANDVMVVRPLVELTGDNKQADLDKQGKAKKKEKPVNDILIPYLMGTVVKKVDLAAGAIIVDWSNE